MRLKNDFAREYEKDSVWACALGTIGDWRAPTRRGSLTTARTYQTTGQDKLANIGNRRYAMARRQRGQLPAPVVEQDIGTDKQCAGAPLNDSRKCSIDFAYGLRIQDQEATSEFACSGRHLFFLHFETRGPGLPQPSNGGWRRHQLMQQPQALWL